MRLIDADALYEKTAEWEASAEANVVKLMRDKINKSECRRWMGILVERRAFKHDVADAPTIDPVKHGKWIEHEWAEIIEGNLVSNYECSQCHGWAREKTDYCPHCGARMRGEEE